MRELHSSNGQQQRQTSFKDNRHTRLGHIVHSGGDVFIGHPIKIEGINTFLLVSNGVIKFRFNATCASGAGHSFHIMSTASEFREAMLNFCPHGTEVEAFQADGSIFRYTYHRIEEDESDS